MRQSYLYIFLLKYDQIMIYFLLAIGVLNSP